MSLWQIAASNVWRNRGRYLTYLGSAAFAVMIYFDYTALALHPQLHENYRGAELLTSGIRAASVVIAAITFVFLLSSNTAFIGARKKEFGLLTLMGVSRSQLIRLILAESLLIGLSAIAIGLGFGLLFLRLFFMVISALLQLSDTLPMYVGVPVWTQTLGLFGTFFLLVSLYSLKDVVGSSVIELIRAERMPKSAPTFKGWKALLGLTLIGLGYAWASLPIPTAIILGVVPVTVMVSSGTLLLMREFSIAVLDWLRRRESFYFRPTPFLSVSQLGHKLQENYLVLSNTAIAIAVILTSVGTIFSMFIVMADDSRSRYPHAFQVVEVEAADSVVGEVERVLEEYGVKSSAQRSFVTTEALLRSNQPGAQRGLLVPYSTYATVRRMLDQVLPLPGDDGALNVHPYTMFDPHLVDMTAQRQSLTVGEQHYWLSVQPEFGGLPVNAGPAGDHALVLSDEVFDRIVSEAPAELRLRVTIWEVADWRGRATVRAVADLSDKFPSTDLLDGPHISSTIPAYQSMVSALGLALFVGVFVSLVFFATSCSVLYFRLFTEIDEDRRFIRRLRDLGVSLSELRSVSLGQTLVIFFVPFLVGLLHSTFAMKALGMLMQRTVLHYGWLVAVGYLVLYGLYFVVAYTFYWRRLSTSTVQAS